MGAEEPFNVAVHTISSKIVGSARLSFVWCRTILLTLCVSMLFNIDSSLSAEVGTVKNGESSKAPVNDLIFQLQETRFALCQLIASASGMQKQIRVEIDQLADKINSSDDKIDIDSSRRSLQFYINKNQIIDEQIRLLHSRMKEIDQTIYGVMGDKGDGTKRNPCAE